MPLALMLEAFLLLLSLESPFILTHIFTGVSPYAVTPVWVEVLLEITLENEFSLLLYEGGLPV